MIAWGTKRIDFWSLLLNSNNDSEVQKYRACLVGLHGTVPIFLPYLKAWHTNLATFEGWGTKLQNCYEAFLHVKPQNTFKINKLVQVKLDTDIPIHSSAFIRSNMFIHLSEWPSVCLSLHPSMHQSINGSTSECLKLCLNFHPSTKLAIQIIILVFWRTLTVKPCHERYHGNKSLRIDGFETVASSPEIQTNTQC